MVNIIKIEIVKFLANNIMLLSGSTIFLAHILWGLGAYKEFLSKQ